MNVGKLKDNLHDASNVLVLAPLTPDGNQRYMELLALPPEKKYSYRCSHIHTVTGSVAH